MAQESARKRVPIGVSDYKKLVSENFYYVDKTLLIEQMWNAGEVVLIPRPRRFGKTINLSMARYFFEKADTDFQVLFGDCNLLKKYPEYHQLMGKFPVIFLTFKDVGEKTWQDTYQNFKDIIGVEFERHSAIYDKLTSQPSKIKFEKIWKGKAERTDFTSSLQLLSRLLYECYQKEVIIILDEYDAPLHKAYINGYYEQAVSFTRALMSKALKDNVYLHKSFITGILAVAKEGMFSGLNNINIFNVTRARMADSFGFTGAEVAQLLNYYDVSERLPAIKQWYDGYRFGNKSGVFNPWSVLKCIDDGGNISTYWANTSDDALIKKLLPKASEAFKIGFEVLLTGGTIEESVNESIIMPDLDTQIRPLWSLLLYGGYLTYLGYIADQDEQDRGVYTLCLPNQEIIVLFRELINEIFAQACEFRSIQLFIDALSQGNVEDLTVLMQDFIFSSISVLDIPEKETEKSYHLFVLGLLVTLKDVYDVKSNRESGAGRYDIMLIPKNKNLVAIIIEFKMSLTSGGLVKAVDSALKQIEDKNYAQNLKDLGFKDYRAYGMAFYRKEVLIKMESSKHSSIH